jgi:anaerobic ribonucleoside-triphosphate reductase
MEYYSQGYLGYTPADECCTECEAVLRSENGIAGLNQNV